MRRRSSRPGDRSSRTRWWAQRQIAVEPSARRLAFEQHRTTPPEIEALSRCVLSRIVTYRGYPGRGRHVRSHLAVEIAGRTFAPGVHEEQVVVVTVRTGRAAVEWSQPPTARRAGPYRSFVCPRTCGHCRRMGSRPGTLAAGWCHVGDKGFRGCDPGIVGRGLQRGARGEEHLDHVVGVGVPVPVTFGHDDELASG